MRILRALLGLLLTGAFTWALNTKLGDAPPMGRFLSPFTGFWRNMQTPDPATETLTLPALQAPVRVAVDEHHIAHVFAQNDHDLYFAQGFLTARDRLWQMEFQTRVAAGRVSEIVGPKALELDRYQRRIGMGVAAERAAATMLADSVTGPVVRAYCAGVNAYRLSLSAGQLPLEYKLLDYRPEPWTAVQVGLLLKLMAYDLTGKTDDYRMSNIRAALGPAATEELFPNEPQRTDPVVPLGTPLEFKPEAVPLVPAQTTVLPASPSQRYAAARAGLRTPPAAPVTAFEESPEEAAAIGSNNWAVSGRRSATGFPLLANDPHLQLNLPSIWYEMQLAAPGVNACGATLPGAPAVVSGFNQRVAWGVTNTYADVLDWYRITFTDSTHRHYRVGTESRPVTLKVERIRVRGAADVLDTVRWTHLGPITRDRAADKPFNPQVPPGCALRWLAHDAGANELRAFHQLNRAASYADYVAALTHYACPAQNFVFASADQDIALWPNGRFVRRYPGQGKYLLDGADPAQAWQGWLPHTQNPHVRNPARGFVSSANQTSTGPEYPYYLNWDFADYARGHRINEVLSSQLHTTPQAMMDLQNDVLSVNARDLLPILLPILAPTAPAAPESPLTQKGFTLLQAWDYRYPADAAAPVLYEVWYGLLLDAIWHDELGGSDAAPMRYPSRDRTRRLLTKAPDTARWFDDVTTPEHRETRTELVRRTFGAALDTVQRKFGPEPTQWRWWRQKSTDIKHVARLAGFGYDDLACGGAGSTPNAITERNGPSWKLVVALGPRGPQAWGVYPGGQSGNAGSPYYADQLDAWRTGQLYPLLFLSAADAADPRIKSRLTLNK